jgi:hypothetical protein
LSVKKFCPVSCGNNAANANKSFLISWECVAFATLWAFYLYHCASFVKGG